MEDDKLTQELREPRRLSIMFDSDEDCVQEHENDDEPVESLALN